MSIIHLLIILVVIAFFLYMANAYIPMQATMRKILNFVVIVLVVLWLLQVFGIFSGAGVPRIT